jgi:Domain of unknown function (DUF4203)
VHFGAIKTDGECSFVCNSYNLPISLECRTSFFLVGFYTLSLVCLVIILKFGVLAAVNPPSKTLRGLFVLACTVAGFSGGAIAIFFWKGAKYFIGAWGGFAVGLWIQCFHNGGLISPIGIRWILYIGMVTRMTQWKFLLTCYQDAA